MLSKKTYAAIANILEGQRWVDNGNPSILEALDELTEKLADHFKHDNPAFDHEKFMTAAGYHA